jgi:parallel beta-helix repeat protein
MSLGINTRITNTREHPSTFSRGNTLYVGGTGDGNYTKIQDAINNASDWDTVFVYNGTYYENVNVTKSINLIGEDRDTTVIDGNYIGDVLIVFADWVNISGFTIYNGGRCGMTIYSHFNIVVGNKIMKFDVRGIMLDNSNSNTIKDNIILTDNYDGQAGIYLKNSNSNTISDNNILGNYYGIKIQNSYNNSFTNNTLLGGFEGILIKYSNSNIISNNTISDDFDFGIEMECSLSNIITGNIINLEDCWNDCACIYFHDYSNNNIIYHNNFINNYEYFNNFDDGDNIWDDGKYGNYWGDYEDRYPYASRSLLKPWMWNIPYKIWGGNNQDNCPLIEQWPKSKTRTIQKDIASYSFYLLRFLEQFPILHRLLSL